MATEDTAEPTSEEFALRPGSREDLPDLREVFDAATSGPGRWASGGPRTRCEPWFGSLLDRPGRELWVAVRGELQLGFVLLDGDWLNLIFVHPGPCGRGVGGALLDLVKACARMGSASGSTRRTTAARDLLPQARPGRARAHRREQLRRRRARPADGLAGR
jgi:GNAT superfamily N-acetyltransferase